MKIIQNLLCLAVFCAALWLMTDLMKPGSKNENLKGEEMSKIDPSLSSTVAVHEVVKGDTIVSIARKYAVTEEAIRTLNGFDVKRSLIRSGDTILIPRLPLKATEVVASWYGPGFHKKRMANGQVYNQHDPTIVAHKDLPLGTDVLVINLENGKAAHAKVLDRGPYVEGRGLDCSEALAKKLGFKKQGLTMVRLVALPNESRMRS